MGGLVMQEIGSGGQEMRPRGAGDADWGCRR